jgi:hypothetical protein
MIGGHVVSNLIVRPGSLPELLVLSVENYDIAYGERGMCGTCPVARSAFRRLGRVVSVNAGFIKVKTVTISGAKTYVDYRLPTMATAFILAYDLGPVAEGHRYGETVRPFSFCAPLMFSKHDWTPSESRDWVQAQYAHMLKTMPELERSTVYA